METNFQKIQQLLSLSDLSAEERSDLLALLSGATNEELEPLATLFAEDSSWMRKISENHKVKQAAFTGKSKVAWTRILKGEETLLKDLV